MSERLQTTLLATLEPLLAQAGMDWSSLALSVGFLLLALILLVLEIFVVSFGVLFLCAVAAAGAAIYHAFEAGDLAGWLVTAITPCLGVLLVRWGLKRIRRSRYLVAQAEIGAEAGYHHLLDELGIGIGARGHMVTAARPSGRARFAGGECDVQSQSGSLERGDPVVVRAVDGPIVFVTRANDETDSA
ncbi:MAG: NfeD family protein [Gammaproteobacteria bacterium]|nr:NfeD family protein [Gammaproteobacteria bacterium]